MDNLKMFACITIFLVSFLAFSFEARAAYGPRAYVSEYISQDYWWNGTAKSPDVRRGQIEVSVPNNWDVLQYVRVNVTPWGGNTNIANMFYDNVITSYPTTDNKDPIYANITGQQQATYYNITNITASPTLNLTLSMTNWAGGTDIYDSDNLGTGGSENNLRFNLTIKNPSADIALTGVTLFLQFRQNSGGGTRDAVNITNSTVTVVGGGSGSASDPQSDGDLERITWTGNLGSSGLVYILFNATLLEGTNQNINAGDNTVNLDSNDKGVLGNYSQTGTLSGITINYKLARGAIRQGVDLQISNGVWYARGFVKNMANDSLTSGQPLTYNVTAWRIYEVDPSTGAPYVDANVSGEFNQTAASSYLSPTDGTIYTTDAARSSNTVWYNTSSSSKPYVAMYFDWYVMWNDTAADNYLAYINTTMDMQDLYKVDMANTKSLTGVIYPDTGGQTVTVIDNSTYTGQTGGSISVGKITMYSIIPVNTTAGNFHGLFTISSSSVKVYYVNATGVWQLKGDANVNWSVTQPTYYGQNGTVRVDILDLSLAGIVGTSGTVGRNFSAATDKLMLQYDVASNVSMTTGDTYVFTGNSTFSTNSGTSDSEYLESQSIQVSSKRLIGYKDLFIVDPANPTRINATISVTVESSAGEYIGGIKFIDYVVNGTFGNNAETYAGNLTVEFYNGTWNTWANGTGYIVTFNGTRQLTDGTWVEVFEFTNASAGGLFNLTSNETIRVRYRMDIGTSGTYVLPLQIAAFDPATGQSFSAEAIGVIRVDVPEAAVPLQITDHSLELAKRVVVGTPALWIKSFEVYNPNARMVSSNFETTVFGDAMDAFVSYYNERGEKIEESVTFGDVSGGAKKMNWGSTLGPMETRIYEVRVLTPPVMEIDRDVEVLDKLENKMVKLKMDVFLKSFAEESYANLVLNLPIGYENVIEVKDGFGRQLQFTGGKDSTSIIVDEIEPSGMKTISILYKASYPTIIITPDRDRYDLNSPVSLEILVINGGESIEYPYMEIEIYTPGMDVIYSNMERLKTMEPLEKTQMYEKFVVPMDAPGGMYVATAKFREDFKVLASGTGNFLVVGAGTSTPEALQIIAVLSVTCVLAYFSLKRLREVRKTKALMENTGVLTSG